jgi:hypothetical protein
MRVKRVVLEHHCEIAMLRRYVIDTVAVDEDVPRRYLFKTREHSQCGRLATTGRSQQHDKLSVVDGQGKIVDDGGAAESLGYIFELNRHANLIRGGSLKCGALSPLWPAAA